MSYVIAEPCVDVKNGACVEVCPVDCIHTTPEDPQHYIDPDVCIECEQCVLVCPVEAVFLDRELPDKWQQYTEINAAFFRKKKESETSVPLVTAIAMIRAAQSRAIEVGAAVSVAIVDGQGKTVLRESMAGADPGSAALAEERASGTVVRLRSPSEQEQAVLIDSGPKGSVIAQRPVSAQPGVMPILEGVNLMGAIGVAGGSDDQNLQCTRAGLATYH
jgi:ferredoxin